MVFEVLQTTCDSEYATKSFTHKNTLHNSIDSFMLMVRHFYPVVARKVVEKKTVKKKKS